MVNVEKYINSSFWPLDIIGTTSFGIVPRVIWRMTWGKKNRLKWYLPYRFRSMQSTHTAVTCLGRNGKKWFMEMDGGKFRTRYISQELGNIVTPEEFALLEHSCREHFEEVRIFSGVALTSPDKYTTRNRRARHICWIGRMTSLTESQIALGNEWLFDKYRNGVPYDYADLIALWNVTKGMKIIGTNDIYVCSELPQRCYEHIDALKKTVVPMTPMDWQIKSDLTAIRC